MNPLQIAKFCHEINRAYCNSIGDYSQEPWEDTPKEIQQSAVSGVEYHLKNDATPEESHNEWMRFKEADGWVYGEEKCIEKKTHPCMRPYHELPQEQQTKDYLFKATVLQCQALPLSASA